MPSMGNYFENLTQLHQRLPNEMKLFESIGFESVSIGIGSKMLRPFKGVSREGKVGCVSYIAPYLTPLLVLVFVQCYFT
jgi:hypothetical protein